MPHTGTYRGKAVKIITKKGEVIIDKFHERNDRNVFLKDYGKIAKSDIKTFIILKGGNHDQTSTNHNVPSLAAT